MPTNHDGLSGVSGRTVASSLDSFEQLIRASTMEVMASDPELAPQRWWKRLLPILVAFNAFALGAQYINLARFRSAIERAHEAEARAEVNLARSRELLKRALTCQSYWPEQDDAGQVSSL